MYYTEGKQLVSNKWCAYSTSHFMYVCMYLASAVGGDRVGGAVLDIMVCVHLDLLVTGVCSQERAVSCMSSCAQLQWVTWRVVDTEVGGGTYCTV